ncbi:hypothetical protein D3C86_1293740 [compost metagenome]
MDHRAEHPPDPFRKQLSARKIDPGGKDHRRGLQTTAQAGEIAHDADARIGLVREKAVHFIEQPAEQRFDAFFRPDFHAEHEHVGKFADDLIDPLHQRRAPETRHGKPEFFRPRRLQQRHRENAEQKGRCRHGAAPRRLLQTAALSR